MLNDCPSCNLEIFDSDTNCPRCDEPVIECAQCDSVTNCVYLVGGENVCIDCVQWYIDADDDDCLPGQREDAAAHLGVELKHFFQVELHPVSVMSSIKVRAYTAEEAGRLALQLVRMNKIPAMFVKSCCRI